MKIKIKRYPEGIEEFHIDICKSLTLLDLLYVIKESFDPTLTFRSMCRAGVCGTCAIKMNGKPVLACSTRIAPTEEEIQLEAIDGFKVIKDLVTEQEGIILKLKSYKIWYHPLGPTPKIGEDLIQRTSRSWECILCGICDSVCPVLSTTSAFGGPLILTRLYKLTLDPRNKDLEGAIKTLQFLKPELCTHCMNCSYACPKKLMPEAMIREEEGILLDRGLIKKEEGFDFLSF